MPMQYTAPDILMTHEGVTVFCTYSDGLGPASRYWFTTVEDDADDDSATSQFDARMFAGLWDETPTVGAWDDWWMPRFNFENEAVEALIRTAIEQGKITAGGD